jgi:hypothetical protein
MNINTSNMYPFFQYLFSQPAGGPAQQRYNERLLPTESYNTSVTSKQWGVAPSWHKCVSLIISLFFFLKKGLNVGRLELNSSPP